MHTSLNIALGLLIFGSVPWQAHGAEPWTLEMLVERGRETSHSAEIAAARLASAEAAAEGARAGRWPSLEVGGTYVQTDEPMSAFGAILNQGTFDNSINFNRPGTIDALTTQLEARYALYTGGRQSAVERAAAAGREEAAAEREAALLELESAIAQSYFLAREARLGAEALEAAIEALDESLRHARLREEAGDAHASTRLDLEATRAERLQQQLAMEERAALARRRLTFLVGLPLSNDIDLAQEDSTSGTWRVPGRSAIREHPALDAAEAAVRGATAQTDAARGARLPQVEAFGRYQYERGWRRDGEGNSWLAGVGIRVPVFDGFAIRSQVREGLAQEQAAEAQRAQALGELELRFRNAEGAYELAEADLEAARARFAAAEASAELTRTRFSADAVDSTALLAAEARLIEADMAQTRATLNRQLALANLHLASGHSLVATTLSR